MIDNVFLADEQATVSVGQKLADVFSLSVGSLNQALVIYLQGGLGAGKTTFSRGFLQGLGHEGSVKSPTYTLVEPYELEQVTVYHFDLYRLNDPQELEYMGIEEYFHAGNICLVEWPDKGEGIIPPADIVVSLALEGSGRSLQIQGLTKQGEKCEKAFFLPAK